MARRLRVEPGLGLVTTVSGLLTKPGLAIWSTEPDGRPPLVGDLVPAARDATVTVDVLDRYDGEVVVAASTVTYAGFEPNEVIAIGRTPAGDHVIAKTTRPDLVDRALTTGIVGHTARVAANDLVEVGTGSSS